ncbi:unnamed protein product [Closterium sp. NIES-64]|nr:unnamed protein product [Closterium sp. NIES-64]
MGKEIGRGSYGVVVECTHRGTGQRFACKIVSKARLKSVLERQVLTQEIALMRALAGHPGIVRLEGVYEDGSDVFMVMEYCNGGELYQKIFHEGKMPEPLAARVFRQLSDAVRYCHARGVMHRDLKPENVLLHYPNRPDGAAAGAGLNMRSEAMAAIQVKLADFGLGLVLPPGVFATVCVGSLMYEAPEVVLGDRYNHKADVWSLGVILYVLLSGGLPFMDKDDRRLARKICEGRYEMRFSPWPFVSDDAKSLVRRLLVVDPNRRSSVEEFINHPWLVAHCGPAAPIVLDGSEVPLPRTPSALWRADAGSVSAAIRAALPNASAAAAAAAAAASSAASSAAAAAAAAASQLKSDVWAPMGRGAWGMGSSAGNSSESGSSSVPSDAPSSSVIAAVAAAVARRNGAADDSSAETAEAAPAAPAADDASPGRILMTSLSEPVTEPPSSPSSSYASARSNSWVEPPSAAADGAMDDGLDMPPAGPRRRMWRLWRMRWMKRGWRLGLMTGVRGAEKLDAGGEGAGARLPRTRANVFGACFGCFFAQRADFETSADRLWEVEDEAGRPVTAAGDAPGAVTNGRDINGGGAAETGEVGGQRRAGEGGERAAGKRTGKTPKAYQRLATTEEGGKGGDWDGADGEGGEETGGVQVRCRGGRMGERSNWQVVLLAGDGERMQSGAQLGDCNGRVVAWRSFLG